MLILIPVMYYDYMYFPLCHKLVPAHGVTHNAEISACLKATALAITKYEAQGDFTYFWFNM